MVEVVLLSVITVVSPTPPPPASPPMIAGRVAMAKSMDMIQKERVKRAVRGGGVLRGRVCISVPGVLMPSNHSSSLLTLTACSMRVR